MNISLNSKKIPETAEKRACYAKFSQLISHIATHFVFAATELLEVSQYALTPIFSFSYQDDNLPNIATTIPVLKGKIIQWPVNSEHKPISKIYLQLGTGNRINQCQLVLSLLHPDTFEVKAHAHIEGATVKDNQWTKFVLDQPLSAGAYLCQLQSPDADNHINTLFLWLTVEEKFSLDHQDWLSFVAQFSHAAKYTYVSSPSSTVAQLTQLPVITIIMTGHEKTAYVQDSLKSVLTQIYPHWECYLVDNSIPANIPNIITLAKNQNTALELAQGEYTLFMQAGDLLTEDALLEVVTWLEKESVDMLYSDEDQINEKGLFETPYFKPDWAAEMLKGQCYTGQLGVYRTQLLKKIGGIRDSLQALQLWDMILRFTADSHRIQHIPKILYHNRHKIQLPTALKLKTVQNALEREGQKGTVTLTPYTCLLHYPVTGQPLVSIIIPTKDMAHLLESCIESIRTLTTYPHWEIIIVDNGSHQPETFDLFDKYQAELGTAFTVITQDIPFNFSTLVNQGVKGANGELILLLNNDIEILGTPNWLQEMIGFAQLPEIACVGAKLLYPEDNTLQHAGLICGIGGIANYTHRHSSAEEPGYFNHLAMVSNYLAITGACLMIKRSLWEHVNGFNENLPVSFNDVDFCLKLHMQGYRHVVLPQVTLYHYESKTRGLEESNEKRIRIQRESDYMTQHWKTLIDNDPFYNPHLTRNSEDFSISADSIYYNL